MGQASLVQQVVDMVKMSDTDPVAGGWRHARLDPHGTLYRPDLPEQLDTALRSQCRRALGRVQT